MGLSERCAGEGVGEGAATAALAALTASAMVRVSGRQTAYMDPYIGIKTA